MKTWEYEWSISKQFRPQFNSKAAWFCSTLGAVTVPLLWQWSCSPNTNDWQILGTDITSCTIFHHKNTNFQGNIRVAPCNNSFHNDKQVPNHLCPLGQGSSCSLRSPKRRPEGSCLDYRLYPGPFPDPTDSQLAMTFLLIFESHDVSV